MKQAESATPHLPEPPPSVMTHARHSLLFLLASLPLTLVAYRGASAVGLFAPLAVALVLFLLTALSLRREHRSLSELGLSLTSGAVIKLVSGFAAGAVLFLFAALILRGLMPFHWEKNRGVLVGAIASTLLWYLVTNTCEEFAFRGYAFDGLIRSIGLWPAQLVVATSFAAFHLLSGWPWHIAIFSTTVGSLLFGLVFVRWRSLPAAIGLHVAWNFSRDLILGSPLGVSALLRPVGLESWSPSQWHSAQAIFIGVSLAACAALMFSIHKSKVRPA